MNSLIRITFLVSFILACKTSLGDSSEESIVRQLDHDWEMSFLNQDEAEMIRIVHPKFVWVHNHGVKTQESKAELMGLLAHMQKRRKNWRIDNGLSVESKGPPAGASRTQHDVKVVINDSTAIVYGFLHKNLSDAYAALHPELNREVIYNFMRTYTKEGDTWLLLGNHTMEVPESDLAK